MVSRCLCVYLRPAPPAVFPLSLTLHVTTLQLIWILSVIERNPTVCPRLAAILPHLYCFAPGDGLASDTRAGAFSRGYSRSNYS